MLSVNSTHSDNALQFFTFSYDRFSEALCSFLNYALLFLLLFSAFGLRLTRQMQYGMMLKVVFLLISNSSNALPFSASLST